MAIVSLTNYHPALFCRLGTISLLFIPAIGWVGFNILQPLFNQLNRMGELAEDAKGAAAKPARRR